MKSFRYTSKIILCVMCLLTVIILLRHLLYFKPKSWNFLPSAFFDTKYILLWTNPHHIPFNYMGIGRSVFISRKCIHTNCVVTSNKNFFSDIGMFDVIAFHGPEIINMGANELPQRRLYHQKYVFASIESSDNYPLCSANYDGYFNWTWTYKLNSEVRWGYFVIRDSNKDLVGPGPNMNWLEWSDMADVNNETKKILRHKTKAVAWFVSNCKTRSRREGYVMGLQKYLNKYDLQIDIFGACGSLECSRDKEEECNKMIETDYYFYLAFENSFSEDYVTEKLLRPLQNNAVPIVYGGADYSRFLPPDSYLDARELGVYDLGDQIYKLIQDPELYAQYFRWKNHYSYHRMSENVESDEYCQMCALLNNEEKMTQTSVYKEFQKWWDPPLANCYQFRTALKTKLRRKVLNFE